MADAGLPCLCMRCNEPIVEGQPTEHIPFIPRWGLSALAHVGCEPKVLRWYFIEDDELADENPLRDPHDSEEGRPT